MSMHLTTDRAGAIPITAVTKTGLPEWIERHPDHGAWLSATGFSAEPGSFAFLPDREGKPQRVLAAPQEGEPIWRFAGLPLSLPPGTYRLEDPLENQAATEAATGWALGSYTYATYKTPKREPAMLALPENADRDETERLAQGVYFARDLINTPAEDMGPEALIGAIEAMAKAAGARVRILRGDALLKENYPCIHTVGRASTRPPMLIDFQWGAADAPKVTLVGKGVCFDTGGLNIKPRDGMQEMKKDMGGAAVVVGLAKTLMAAQAPIRLRVMVPAVDNAIAGNAFRPRDIIRTRAGKTVEIGNTDAEGRLILCDALAEADAEAPELLIDCATLTGAAKIALGPELQALYCDNDEAAACLQATSAAVGDPLWRMPIWKPYRRMIEGKLAELDNFQSTPLAGSIAAALFLAEFVAHAKTWAHLDIMAANLTARPGRPEGGEATGMRALYAFIRERFG
jgi:leucyl aminopeptidase